MQKLKRIFQLKSFRLKILVVVVLAVLAAGLLWLGGFFEKSGSDSTNMFESLNGETNNGSKTVNVDALAEKCNRDVDSILFNFGIRKEWIRTSFPPVKNQLTEQNESPRQQESGQKPGVRWFTKDISIPQDITTAEINLDLTTYVNFLGLRAVVNENIRTTAIYFAIYPPSDTGRSEKMPLAKINITPTNGIKRTAGSLVLIISRINEFSKENLENILSTAGEFSFIFPRNPEDVELQNKLIQLKKDVLVNLTVGMSDNFDADFRIGMDEKEIKQRVKSIISDFPLVRTAILSKSSPEVPDDIIFRILTEEFRSNGTKAFRDTILTKLMNDGEEPDDNSVRTMIDRLKEKASLKGKVIAVLSLSNDVFTDFLEEVQTLKKLGYKFYTFSEFISKEKQTEKKETELKQKETAKSKDKAKTKTKKRKK